MNESLFSKYIAKFFPKLQRLVELVNGKRNSPTYLFKEHLRTEYAPDNKWESASVNTSHVAADVVALDSELPIKSRGTLHSASGRLPKLGMAKVLRESDINNLNVMEAQGGNQSIIVQRLASDGVACAVGIDEICEKNFLEGLSEGCLASPDDADPNSLLRVNFGYLAGNTFGATTKGQISLEDIKNVINAADAAGNTITTIWVAKSTYDALRQTREAKELYANYAGQVFTDNSNLPTPTASRFNEAFADDNNGIRFLVVDRSVIVEKNGKKTPVKPWNANRLVFTGNDIVGTLVYGRLAEQTNPAQNVEYTQVDTYKLISKYSLVNPLREVTAGQAFALPVIEDVDQIYVLDITEAQEVDSTTEASDSTDVKVTVWGNTYKKPEFVAELNKVSGKRLASTATDEKIIAAVNALSDADEAKLKANAESAKA